MKKLIIISFLFVFSIHANAQINFEQGNWASVVAKAKKENKMIFVDAYTTWCGPCKWMAKNTFTDPSVGEYHNANFVNYKFDMEKGEGVKFARDFNVEAYPTLLYLTADAEVAFRSEGSMDAASFLALGKSVFAKNETNENAKEEDVQDGDMQEEGTNTNNDWGTLNDKAWQYYENETSKSKLGEAAQWAMQSIELNENYFNTDTYAHLLYKLGNKQESLKWALKAVKLGKTAGEDVSITEKLIQQIKKNK